MARQNFYGDTLRNARERKGMDLATAARRLRIRADILQAIEDGDFSRMPPRGYTRNMVNAYARLVGVNPSEMTERYMDAAYQHETGRLPSSRDNEGSYGRSSRFDRGDRHGRGEAGSSRGSRQRMSDRGSYGSSQPSRSFGLGGGSGRDRNGGSYPGMYSNNKPGFQIGPHLPLIVVGVVIIVLLIVILVLVLGPKDNDEPDAPAVPITGLTDPTSNANSNDDANQNAASGQPADPFTQATAPTQVEFSYSIADGSEAYVEIKLGDSGVFDTAAILTGPVSKTYTLNAESPTLSFVTTSPQNVTLRLDDEKVEAEELTRQPGVYGYTVDFNAILQEWKADHPDAASASNTNANDNANSNGNTNTSNQ